MENAKIKLLNALADGTDLFEIVREMGISIVDAAAMITSPGALDIRSALRTLSRAQSELLASRHASAAVCTLRDLMGKDKPEVQLRAALALREIFQEEAPAEAKTAGAEEPPVVRMDPAECKARLHAVSQALLQYRQDAAMGPVRQLDTK